MELIDILQKLYFRDVAYNAKHPATKIIGTVANPSKPSVKFTALDEPTITNK